MKYYALIFGVMFGVIFEVAVYARPKIPAKDIVAFDKNNEERNLQDILNQIVPTNDAVDLSSLIATAAELNTLSGIASTLTAAELNILDGISANVTASNLNELTGSGATTLHLHAGGSGSSTTLNQAYSNSGTAATRIIDLNKGSLSFNETDSTNDYNVVIDNTTTGNIADGLLLQVTGVGGTTTDAIDISDSEFTNAINAGDNTITGTTTGISFTNFAVTSEGSIRLSGGTVGAANTIDFGNGSNDDLTAADVTDLTDGGASTLHSHASSGGADTLTDVYARNGTMITDGANFVVNLTDATNDYNMVIDNTTSGTIADALIIQSTGAAGTAITEAIDVSDADIVHAINIGANQITGDSFKFDGVGQLEIGKGGGGGGGSGTGILTFIGGGAIDSTRDGDVVIQPDDAGIVDFPSGTTVRLPPASPAENRDGLFWNEVNDTLCIDKSADLCTAALTLANVSLNKSDMKTIKESIPVLASLVSSYYAKPNMLLMPGKDFIIPPDREKIAKFLGLSSKQVDKLYSLIDSSDTSEKRRETSYLYDRGEAQLHNGSVSIELRPEFLEVIEVDKDNSLIVQVTPLTSDVQGVLVVSKRTPRYFVVEEANGGKSNAWFMWEVSAKEKEVVKMKRPPQIEFERKPFAF